LKTGKPEAGGEAEVALHFQSKLGVPVAVVHSHPGMSAELTDEDYRVGEAVAKETGEPFSVYAIGLADDGESMTMTREEFEP
jgi:proteasome lid subunit RPN8/RPN11